MEQGRESSSTPTPLLRRSRIVISLLPPFIGLSRSQLHKRRLWNSVDVADLHKYDLDKDPQARYGYLTQPMDHFDPLVNKHFNQRYWIVDKYWKSPSHPVFLYEGEEAPLELNEVANGKMAAKRKEKKHKQTTSLDPPQIHSHSLRAKSSRLARKIKNYNGDKYCTDISNCWFKKLYVGINYSNWPE